MSLEDIINNANIKYIVKIITCYDSSDISFVINVYDYLIIQYYLLKNIVFLFIFIKHKTNIINNNMYFHMIYILFNKIIISLRLSSNQL